MKYRIVLYEDGSYRVQSRSWWYWWITDAVYTGWKENNASFREDFWTLAEAKSRIEVLKTIEQRRNEGKPKKQEVVYTDP